MALHEMIGDIPLFKNFSEDDKKAFAKMDHSVLAFNKGDVIIKEGDHYTSLYLLIRGSAQVTRKGYDSPVALLKAGSVFGEISFLTRKPRQSNVIAAENIPIRLVALEAVIIELVRAVNYKFKVVEEHLAPIQKHKPED